MALWPRRFSHDTWHSGWLRLPCDHRTFWLQADTPSWPEHASHEIGMQDGMGFDYIGTQVLVQLQGDTSLQGALQTIPCMHARLVVSSVL